MILCVLLSFSVPSGLFDRDLPVDVSVSESDPPSPSLEGKDTVKESKCGVYWEGTRVSPEGSTPWFSSLITNLSENSRSVPFTFHLSLPNPYSSWLLGRPKWPRRWLFVLLVNGSFLWHNRLKDPSLSFLSPNLPMEVQDPDTDLIIKERYRRVWWRKKRVIGPGYLGSSYWVDFSWRVQGGLYYNFPYNLSL